MTHARMAEIKTELLIPPVVAGTQGVCEASDNAGGCKVVEPKLAKEFSHFT